MLTTKLNNAFFISGSSVCVKSPSVSPTTGESSSIPHFSWSLSEISASIVTSNAYVPAAPSFPAQIDALTSRPFETAFSNCTANGSFSSSSCGQNVVWRVSNICFFFLSWSKAFSGSASFIPSITASTYGVKSGSQSMTNVLSNCPCSICISMRSKSCPIWSFFRLIV